MKIEEPIPGWSSYKVYTSTCVGDADHIAALKAQTPFLSKSTPYNMPVYQKPFEPVIHTGNEDVLTWVPQVFGALLVTEICLIGYWLLHLVHFVK